MKNSKNVFCINCKHYLGVLGNDCCNHPSNLKIEKTYLKNLSLNIKTPDQKNLYNNCEDFEKKKFLGIF